MLSNRPSVSRLILAVLRDITGWLIAVATSLKSQSSASTMWSHKGRWAGVGHTHMHTAACTQHYTQVGLIDANMYCVWNLNAICARVKRALYCHSAHGLHLLSSASWFQKCNLAERFRCHLLNVEMSVQSSCAACRCGILFSACHSKYILHFVHWSLCSWITCMLMFSHPVVNWLWRHMELGHK